VLHWAAINNRQELVKYFLSAGAIVDSIGGDLNSTPLQWAVRQGHQSMVALLINNGADPTIRHGEENIQNFAHFFKFKISRIFLIQNFAHFCKFQILRIFCNFQILRIFCNFKILRIFVNSKFRTFC